MPCLLTTVFFLVTAALNADGSVSFDVGGRAYRLAGAQGLLAKRAGRTQLVVAVKDTQQKTQFALTAELPGDLEGPIELTSEIAPLTAVIVHARGVYSVVPHVTLSRDDFMRYTKKEEFVTGEMEEDPEDRPEERLDECRRGKSRDCQQAVRERRRRRPKVRMRYTQHAPTWLGKRREQRLAQGDGVVVEERYRDTAFTVRLHPIIVAGKVTGLSGNFAGVVVQNEGPGPAARLPLKHGAFSVTVKDTR